ncbi:unnamed protein product [Ascophyllum nodosum]
MSDRDRADMDRMENNSGDDNGVAVTAEQSTSPPVIEVANVTVSSMVRMATVDNFQGEESKIIIISLVRSNPNCDIGFLRSSNRVNVMLSRAQHGMYIVGNAGKSLRAGGSRQPGFTALEPCMLQKKTGTMWSEFVLPSLRSENAIGPALELQCARHEDAITTIRKPEEFDSLAGDGGCSRACSLRLPCGHTCARRCHPDDPEHRGVRCNEPCPRLHQPCEHPCTLLCGDDCGLCRQKIDAVDLPCGHRATNVTCAQSRSPESVKCAESVKLEIPGCGHVLSGRCTATRNIVQDPKGCTARCGKPLRCGHSCAAACGRCTKRALKKEDGKGTSSGATANAGTASSSWGTASGLEAERRAARAAEAMATARASVLKAAETRDEHETCKVECGRPRPCGHRCRLPCHEGATCPPCQEKCAISCEHSSCSQGCKDPCAPCAQECTWFCPHEAGKCMLPCGAPCRRLPCDRRCERLLSCDHQCPSVCGEDCPSSAYCRECGGSGAEMDQVVDMLEFTTLKEHDPSVEPVLVLGCGHSYTLSTLDGYMDLSANYDKDSTNGVWSAPKPLGSDCSTLKSCPECRTPVGGLSRYKRVTNKAMIDMAEIKHGQWCRTEIGSAEASLAVAASASSRRVNKAKSRLRQAEGILQRVVRMSRTTPSTQMYEATKAKLQLDRATPQEIGALSRLQPDGSLHVKALTALGRLRTLKLEIERHELFEARLARSMVDATRPRGRATTTPESNQQLVQRNTKPSASQLEERAIRTYEEGYKFLQAAISFAKETRTSRAEAEAKLAMAELNLQGAQCVVVSRKLAHLLPEAGTPEVMRLTEFGRAMVGRGMTACREVAACPLESVRQQHAKWVKSTLENLSKLDAYLEKADFITEAEIKMVKAAAANTGLYGGVTKWYRCPNGHTYGVGNCGELNASGACPECGARIGGLNNLF